MLAGALLGISSLFWWQHHPQPEDLPLCSVADLRQKKTPSSPALGDPLQRCGERKGFTSLSSLGRWEPTTHRIPKEKRER